MSTTIGRVHRNVRHAGSRHETATWLSTVGLMVTLALGISVAPLAADAQRPRPLPRVAYLALAPGPWAISSDAFGQELRELGYVEGQNILLEYRWSAGNVDRLREHAAEVVRRGET